MHYEVENKQPTSATTRKDSRKLTSFSIQNNYLGIRKTPFLEGWNSGKGNWSCSRISFTGSMWQQVTSSVSDHLQIANPTGLDSVRERKISLADLQPQFTTLWKALSPFPLHLEHRWVCIGHVYQGPAVFCNCWWRILFPSAKTWAGLCMNWGVTQCIWESLSWNIEVEFSKIQAAEQDHSFGLGARVFRVSPIFVKSFCPCLYCGMWKCLPASASLKLNLGTYHLLFLPRLWSSAKEYSGTEERQWQKVSTISLNEWGLGLDEGGCHWGDTAQHKWPLRPYP